MGRCARVGCTIRSCRRFSLARLTCLVLPRFCMSFIKSRTTRLMIGWLPSRSLQHLFCDVRAYSVPVGCTGHQRPTATHLPSSLPLSIGVALASSVTRCGKHPQPTSRRVTPQRRLVLARFLLDNHGQSFLSTKNTKRKRKMAKSILLRGIACQPRCRPPEQRAKHQTAMPHGLPTFRFEPLGTLGTFGWRGLNGITMPAVDNPPYREG